MIRTNFDERIHVLEKERYFLNQHFLNKEPIENWRINDFIHDCRILAGELEKEVESLRAMAEVYEKLRK